MEFGLKKERKKKSQLKKLCKVREMYYYKTKFLFQFRESNGNYENEKKKQFLI